MKITWYGHSCFAIASASGKVLVTDPFESGCYGGACGYPRQNVFADVATISHTHPDHDCPAALNGRPTIVRGEGRREVAGFAISGIGAFHDERQGKDRGPITIFQIEVDGLRVVHLGDLGHLLSESQARVLAAPDLLMIPVGGTYTIDAAGASSVVETLAPRVTIPMHYKTPAVSFPIAGVEGFLEGKKGVKALKASRAEVARETLPRSPEIWVFDYVKSA